MKSILIIVRKSIYFPTILIAGFASLLLTSCNKEELLTPTSDQEEIIGRAVSSYPGTSYVAWPGIGIAPLATIKDTTMNSVFFTKGQLKSSIIAISGSVFYIKVERSNGAAFPVGSLIKLMKGSTVVASTISTSSVTYYTFILNETQSWNNPNTGNTSSNYATKYFNTWWNPVTNLRYYTHYLRTVAVPTGWSQLLGNLNGVSLYSNGWGGFTGTNFTLDPNYSNSQKFQCVHYPQKYYKDIYSTTIGNANASDYWFNNSSHNLYHKVINGQGIPQTGDIICFSSSSGSYHVGVVKGVVGGKLRVYHENVGQTLQSNGNYCSPYKDFSYTIVSNGYYNVNASALNGGGGTTWNTLGWVRL